MQTIKDVFKNPWVKAVGLVLFLVLLGWIVYHVRDVLTPFILAFIFAYIFNPIVNFLERRRIRRELAIVILIVVVLGLLAFGIYLLQRDIREAIKGVTIVEEIEPDDSRDGGVDSQAPAADGEPGDAQAPAADGEPGSAQPDSGDSDAGQGDSGGETPEQADGEQDIEPDDTRGEAERWIARRMQEIVQRLPERYRTMATELAESLYRALLPRIEAILVWLSENLPAIATASAAAIVNFLVQLGVFVIATIYLMRDLDTLTERIKQLLPSRYKDDILRIAGKIDTDLRNFISGQILVVLIMVLMFSVGLWLADIPYAFPIALVSGVGNLVPYLGFTLGIVIGGIITIIGHGFDIHLVYFFAIYVIVQSIESGILTPNIVGSRVKFNPVLVLLAIMVFARLLGLMGIIFAVPLAAIVRVFAAEIYAYHTRHKQISVVMPAQKKPPHDEDTSQKEKERPEDSES